MLLLDREAAGRRCQSKSSTSRGCRTHGDVRTRTRRLVRQCGDSLAVRRLGRLPARSDHVVQDRRFRLRPVLPQRSRLGIPAGGRGRGQPGLRQPDGGRRATPGRARARPRAPAAASTSCCPPGGSGPTGFAYGVDMTDEMLALARANAAKAGATNVEFLKGTIEDVPLPDGSVDVVISNCVINLSVDKPAVHRRDVPGPHPRRSDRDQRRRRGRPALPGRAGRARLLRRLHRRRPVPNASTWTVWPRPGSSTPPYGSPTRPPTDAQRDHPGHQAGAAPAVDTATVPNDSGSRTGRRPKAVGTACSWWRPWSVPASPPNGSPRRCRAAAAGERYRHRRRADRADPRSAAGLGGVQPGRHRDRTAHQA